MAPELRFERTIQAVQPTVFQMFTSPAAVCEWLCDRAMLDARTGGYYFCAWNNGYYASGAFNQIQAENEISFTWHGKHDPDVSQVHVLLESAGSGTKVSVLHSGLGEGGGWETAREEIRAGWETALDNLANVLEKGPDLRIINRPMLGFVVGAYSPEVAEMLDVPVRQGVRLEGVLEGLSAEKAGLQENDVVVELEGQSLANFNDVAAVLQGKRAGDEVEVVYYRGPEKLSTRMKLAPRKLPDFPMQPIELAQQLEKIYQEDYAELQSELVGVSDEEAGHSPGEGEWSAKEVVAHLIQSERLTQNRILSHLQGLQSPLDDNWENIQPYVLTTVKIYQTLSALMEALKLAQAETVELLRNLPADFASRRSSMWLVGYTLLSFPYHGRRHNEQIQAAVRSAREK